MCFVVFFFFKQKTAYEMRISDWSSDVCSSDLPRRHHRRVACLCGAAFLSGAVFSLRHRKVSPPMARIVMKFGGTSLAGIERLRSVAARIKREVEAGKEVEEIGRASCRERVCQDVWISVVT